MIKKIFLALIAILSFTSAFAEVDLDELETVAACNEKIAELDKERLELGKETIVRYRKKDHPSKNIDERLKIVEINREFIHSENSKIRIGIKLQNMRNNQKDYEKWDYYKSKIPESEKRVARMEEIKKDIASIKKYKEGLVKAKKFR